MPLCVGMVWYAAADNWDTERREETPETIQVRDHGGSDPCGCCEVSEK